MSHDYRIDRPEEETDCNWCGMPLYIGDAVSELDENPYCSDGCIAKQLASVPHEPGPICPNCENRTDTTFPRKIHTDTTFLRSINGGLFYKCNVCKVEFYG